MVKKTSAHYQREYRKRLRDQGLVKKEVWVLPENNQRLLSLEKQLRKSMAEGQIVAESGLVPWSTLSLYQALLQDDSAQNGQLSIELPDGVTQSMHIVMHEYGDLPIFLTVSGEQIVAESVLWSVSEVKDSTAFNEAVLRTHKYFSLSTISIDRIAEKDYYTMFGALSSSSRLSTICFELDVLANNVIQAIEAYSEYLALES